MWKWIKRWLTLFCLLMAVACVPEWVLSYRQTQSMELTDRHCSICAANFPGGVILMHQLGPYNQSLVLQFEMHPYNVEIRIGGGVRFYQPWTVDWHYGGFNSSKNEYAADPTNYENLLPRSYNQLPGYTLRSVLIPFWFLIVAFLAWPVLRLTGFIRQTARRSRGACSGCGYDLRASTGRCPECGSCRA